MPRNLKHVCLLNMFNEVYVFLDCRQAKLKMSNHFSGSQVTWGDPDYGGDSSDVQDQLRPGIFGIKHGWAASVVKRPGMCNKWKPLIAPSQPLQGMAWSRGALIITEANSERCDRFC